MSASSPRSNANRVLDSGSGLRVKRVLQTALRAGHLPFRKKLPDRVGIYFHAVGKTELEALDHLIPHFTGLGYRTVTPDEFLPDEGGRRLYLSLDDADRSWLDLLPLLEAHAATATFYIDSARIGEQRPDDAGDRFLTHEEVRRLRDAGHTIGNHTHSHPDLGRLSVAEVVEEVARANRLLESQVDRPVRHFAIPFGMPRNLRPEAAEALLRGEVDSIAWATPGMQFAPNSHGHIQRTGWRAGRDLGHNLDNLRIDGSRFVRLTGRSPLG